MLFTEVEVRGRVSIEDEPGRVTCTLLLVYPFLVFTFGFPVVDLDVNELLADRTVREPSEPITPDALVFSPLTAVYELRLEL